MTTRFMGPDEMRVVASMISKVLTNPNDERIITQTRAQVVELCDRFPLYA